MEYLSNFHEDIIPTNQNWVFPPWANGSRTTSNDLACYDTSVPTISFVASRRLFCLNEDPTVCVTFCSVCNEKTWHYLFPPWENRRWILTPTVKTATMSKFPPSPSQALTADSPGIVSSVPLKLELQQACNWCMYAFFQPKAKPLLAFS